MSATRRGLRFSLADELRLAPNMTGAASLPQTTVLPQVDLVITHGGNNTTTEAMHFGLPMVLLPLFWDQYDNAQRVHEQGFGLRLSTYSFADGELTGAVDRLLADKGVLAERVVGNGEGWLTALGTAELRELVQLAPEAIVD